MRTSQSRTEASPLAVANSVPRELYRTSAIHSRCATTSSCGWALQGRGTGRSNVGKAGHFAHQRAAHTPGEGPLLQVAIVADSGKELAVGVKRHRRHGARVCPNSVDHREALGSC